MARSHYEVLGVPRDATGEELRRAYLERAREAHPDRHIDASSADRRVAELRMQQINEAWRILGNARRRRRYDLETSPRFAEDRAFATRTDGTMASDFDSDGLDEQLDPTARLIRGLPWLVLIIVLFAIFVFTAYAATRNDTSTNSCVMADPAGSGAVIQADCGAPGARRVATTVEASQPCPKDTERLQPTTGLIAYCLEV